MLHLCIFCVVLLMDRFVLCVACLTVFVNCLAKQGAIFLGVFVMLLCVEVFCKINRVWSSKVCVVPVNPVCIKRFCLCLCM